MGLFLPFQAAPYAGAWSRRTEWLFRQFSGFALGAFPAGLLKGASQISTAGWFWLCRYWGKILAEVFSIWEENLPFPDETFNTLVATCVFCTVPDPVRGLQEARRVCSQGGKLLFLEHVRSDGPLLGPLMDFLNPLARSLMGSNINRRTRENMEKAGLEIVEEGFLLGDIFRFFIALP